MAITLTGLTITGGMTFTIDSGTTDPYYSNVSLLLHGDGTNNSTVFTDSSIAPKSLVAVGSAQISTAQSKFGGSSIFIGSGVNNGTAVKLGSSADNNLIFAGDFTVELWLYQTSDTEYAFSGLVTRIDTSSRSSASISSFELGISSFTPVVNVFNTSAGSYYCASSVQISYNTWNHIAVTRSGNTLRIFVNGVLAGSSAVSGSMITNSSQSMIGGSSQSGNPRHSLNGYIDELRITDGIARYTTNFTPPVGPFPQ